MPDIQWNEFIWISSHPLTQEAKSGSAYILVMVDQFTKSVEFAALPAQNAELTIGAAGHS